MRRLLRELVDEIMCNGEFTDRGRKYKLSQMIEHDTGYECVLSAGGYNYPHIDEYITKEDAIYAVLIHLQMMGHLPLFDSDADIKHNKKMVDISNKENDKVPTKVPTIHHTETHDQDNEDTEDNMVDDITVDDITVDVEITNEAINDIKDPIDRENAFIVEIISK